jgi:mannose-6-phosphate isomerase
METALSYAYRLKTIFNKSHTDCFALNELDIKGEIIIQGNGDFFVGVIFSGEGIMTCGGKDYGFTQEDEIFFPAAVERVAFNYTVASKILLCYPAL